MSVKAYELVELIPRFISPTGDKHVKIECIECSGRYVFIGTSDGHVVKYSVQETAATNGSSSPFVYHREGQRFFDAKKPVRLIKAASALEKLLVLYDTTLYVLNINDLELIGSRLKNVQTFCVNENPRSTDPFLVQICVAPVSKGQLAIHNVTPDDKITHTNTFNIQEPVKCLCADCGIICAALRDKYIILDCDQGQVQDLFPFDKDTFTPYLCKVAKEEFLLSGPDGLGIFVCSAGTSNRPPLQWSYPLTSLTFHHPYILGVSNEIIMVHSIVDQQQKQAIPFLGGQLIGNYDGHIYVCSQTSLFALVPVPWEKQVEALLVDEHVEEALSLLEKVGHSGGLPGQIDPLKKRFKQQAAFIYFARSDLEIALDLFLDSEIDEREIISIFPGIMPSASAFVRTVPPLHNIADVNQLFHGNEKKITQVKQFLLHFLQMAHDSKTSLYCLEIDTALLKLYAELGQSKELESLLESPFFSGDFQSCLAWLKDRRLHHAQALLLLRNGKRAEALSLWCQMISGELNDPNFKGVTFFAQVLKTIGDAEILWQYADLVLDNNEEHGVELFIQKQTEKNTASAMELDPNTVANYLQRYPKALILYLEYLINDKGVEEEKFHTQLAVQYIDAISKLKSQNRENELDFDETVLRLRIFLQKSNLYRAKFLLPKVRDVGLDQEVAVLYGKMGDHEKALSILATQLRDFKGAEEYCLLNGDRKENNSYNMLFHSLLSIYLNPEHRGKKTDEYLAPALDLLNAYASEIDPVKAIEIIPPHWSVNILETFLRGALRSSMNKFRTTKMEKSLAKADSIQGAETLYTLEKHSLKLVESNYCCVCKKPFSDLKFARYPNDVITHVECGRLANVCPLTGHCFSLPKSVQPRS